MTSTINASTSSGIVQSADTSGVLALQTAGTTAVTIDASQNVGIGTSSPSQKLYVNGNIGVANGSSVVFSSSGMSMYAGYTNTRLLAVGGSDGFQINNNANNAINFYLSDAGSLQFNSGYGSVATAYGCRAWVNFNGTGTVAIRASGNVSSITDNGTGNYQVNLTNAMPDVNYAAIASDYSGNNTNVNATNSWPSSTSAVQVRTSDYNGTNVLCILYDVGIVSVAIFR